MKPTDRKLGFATKALHVGQDPDPSTGAIVPPIYQTSTFVQSSPGTHQGYDYARSDNPTRRNYEQALAALEGGAVGIAFASGLAAIATLLDAFDKESEIIACDDLYGGTVRLFEQVRKRSAGLQVRYLDLTDPQALRAAISPQTKMIWLETPTNPLLKILDLSKLAEIAHASGALVVCDNTFASPRLQQPLTLGCDAVLHSATKYIGGHTDLVGGAIVVREPSEFAEKLRYLQNAVGAVPGPFDCFLAHRGLKTLALRVDRQSESALTIARFLETRPAVERVIYPGLESHPQHQLAKRQMSAFGGIVTVILKRDLAGTKRFLEEVKIFSLAESLGGVESLIEHPGIMTHASLSEQQRTAIGITDSLVRLSVGVEDVADLVEDLRRALAA